LASNDSRHQHVNQYLVHCGFYDYVKRSHTHDVSDVYDDHKIVKIKRENNESEIDEREESIRLILERYSSLTEEQIEDFDCNVLIEAFNNVTEHGKSHHDSGWWTITQYHNSTGIISLCLADNGIGIKNSLATGPQSEILRKTIGNEQDGEYIQEALKENVSGALTGSTKENRIMLLKKVYKRGSRRGNGLSRIRETCSRCDIKFSLLSQYGYLSLDTNGKITRCGSTENRLFAGTLYHFTIPAKISNTGEIDENH
jgi:anti-sigma regulatory factor (Ser/Thr protein kinase)